MGPNFRQTPGFLDCVAGWTVGPFSEIGVAIIPSVGGVCLIGTGPQLENDAIRGSMVLGYVLI